MEKQNKEYEFRNALENFIGEIIYLRDEVKILEHRIATLEEKFDRLNFLFQKTPEQKAEEIFTMLEVMKKKFEENKEND